VIRNPLSRVGLTTRLLPVIGLVIAVASTTPALADSATSPGPLTVSQTTNGPAITGVPLTYTITVTNTTSAPATDVFLGDQLPIGARLVGALPNPNLCAKGGAAGSPAFACLVGTLGALGSGTERFSINFTIVPTTTTAFNHAAVTGFANGAFTINSVDLILAPAAAPTDVQVTGFSTNGGPSAGSLFAYVFQVKNGGSQIAPNVTFTDTLPDGFGVGNALSTRGACTISGKTVSCSIGDLGTGNQALIVIDGHAPSVPGTYTTTATVSSGVLDTNPSNNSVAVTIHVR
jgi:uncharacterized repeat protein (TIGR01451 family)